MYSQQFGTIVQPQTYERSFSPLLLETQEEAEGWKVSTLSHHATNQQDGYERKLIQMPSMNGSDCSPTKNRKPLPQVPTLYTTHDDAYYQLNPPVYHPHWQHDHNNHYAEVPCTPMSAVSLGLNVMYHPPYHQQPYIEASHLTYSAPSPSFLDEPEELPSVNSSPIAVEAQLQQHPPKMEENKNVRQITVKSINDDYRVWITVEPKETGESIAEKIHVIATFRTRKITSITTASGRQVPLNKTPVFKNWEDMDDFEHGETWTVTWGPLKKSFMDKVFSKFIET
ncbi:uncharacterized protein ATC70_002253 [Mucor velutinosus]|uniref:Uncharacterized protein n=1 Tax=Mucor velutinosus TaxID=708070 RepID=A0AAN7DBZ1_9FUNG|nr:hypothetical protein ATC70_002253 [Mucor velutinosus]